MLPASVNVSGADSPAGASSNRSALSAGPPLRHKPPDCSALGSPRIFPGTRYVFCVLAQRARGLLIGVDLCPGKVCSFRCVYCQADRSHPEAENRVELEVMAAELRRVLDLAFEDRLVTLGDFAHVPAEWLQLKQVALAGDGEPTFCSNFSETVQAVVHVRAQGTYPFFKIMLVTNGSGLHLPEVERGLAKLNSRDEVWIKLDAGTQACMQRINRTRVKYQRILDNIAQLATHRPVVIQSLFPRVHGQEPPPDEIAAYIRQLLRLKSQGAQIAQVQVFSTHKPSKINGCSHLTLRSLSLIARRVREETGLTVDVF
ncbi:MAG: radical SAM protein [Verrucomicrobia bacterium]|nr:radical SAM protein [Verrucomicrobiota bacterium]